MDLQGRLLDAIKAKDPKRVRAAIAAGADLAADAKKSPLHAAAEIGDVEVIEALPTAAVRKLIDSLDSMDRTPLMCAAQKDRLEAAQALIELGADVNAKSSTGDTALRVTAAEGTPEMARLLLAAGADPLLPGRLLLTPLDRARERRTPEGRMITALFIRAGEAKNARPAGKTAKSGKTGASAARSRATKAKSAKARGGGGSKGNSKRPRRRPQFGVK
jgi:ankyrin repeat protein